MTIFRQGTITATSSTKDSVRELVPDDTDVFICAPSWDSRCICITEAAELSVRHVIVLRFENYGVSGKRQTNESHLMQFLKGKCSDDSLSIIDGRSENLSSVWSSLERLLTSLTAAIGRPIKVVFDMSTCPRYFSMGVLGWGIATGLVARHTFIYAEGRHPRQNSPELFTVGKWDLAPIPYMYGRFDPRLRRFYYVSVGFEGSKTMRVVAQGDPDRVSILLPDPGVLEAYPKRSMKQNLSLIERYCIPSEQIVRASGIDAVSAWKTMSEENVERPLMENTYYLSCGSKAHSLAFALRALTTRYSAVLYNRPTEHKEADIEPSGQFWKFDIRDTTQLSIASAHLRD